MKHSHYKKTVAGHLSAIDVYRVLSLFGVTDQAIGHAIKKLFFPGQRGAKPKRQDIQEAIDTLERWKAMEDEDLTVQMVKVDLDSPASVSDDGLSVGYRYDKVELRANHVALTDTPPDQGCKIFEPASLIDDESSRMQAIAQNGNDGAAYSELDRLRAAEAFNDDLPVSVDEAIALGAVPQREPCQPRHRCQTCAGGHSTHECQSGN